MNKNLNKYMSLVLAFVIVLGFLPLQVLAEENMIIEGIEDIELNEIEDLVDIQNNDNEKIEDIKDIDLDEEEVDLFDNEIEEPKLENGAYQIGTKEELIWFMKEVNSGRADLNADLTDDIDLDGVEFTPINVNNGIFNGNGYEIQNININDSKRNIGLFKVNNNIIKNLKISGQIVSSRDTIGGITGTNNGTIINCVNMADIKSTDGVKGNGIGGIAGLNQGLVTRCGNKGDIEGRSFTGGIVGILTDGVISSSFNNGEITCGKYGADISGGIVGKVDGKTKEKVTNNVYNTGKINSDIGVSSGIIGKTISGGPNHYVYNTLNIGSSKNGVIENPEDVILFNNYFISNESNYDKGEINNEDIAKKELIELLNQSVVISGKDIEIDDLDKFVYVPGDHPRLAWEFEDDLDDSNNEVDPGEPEKPIEEKKEVSSIKIYGKAEVGEELTGKVYDKDGNEIIDDSLKFIWQYWDDLKEELSEEIEGKTFVIPENAYDDDGGRITLEVITEDGKSFEDEKMDIYMPESLIYVNNILRDLEIKDADKDGHITVDKIELIKETSNGTKIKWTSSNPEVIGLDGNVSRDLKDNIKVTLKAEIINGKFSKYKEFDLTVQAIEGREDLEYLNKAKDSMPFQITLDSDHDKNILNIVKDKLKEKGYTDIDVTIKEVSKEEYINKNGDITYYYSENFSGNIINQVETIFEFSKNDKKVEYVVRPVVGWDKERVRQLIDREIYPEISEEVIKKDNESLDSVTGNLILPSRFKGDKNFVEINWTSSDRQVIRISDELRKGNVDNILYGPYLGKVTRFKENKEVTLTANIKFNHISGYNIKELIVKKEYKVNVKGLTDGGFEEELQKLLDDNYTEDKLRSSITRELLDLDNVTNDIQFIIPRATGIDNSHEYSFSVTSDNPDVIEIPTRLHFRGFVYRPLPGEKPVKVNLTAHMTHRDTGIKVSKKLKPVTVQPLTQEEIDRELELMKYAKANYFEGIKGNNSDKNNITDHMRAFTELTYDENGNKVWKYANQETNTGIEPVPIDGWYDLEQWRLFKSSKASVIGHEDLKLIKPEFDEEIKIESVLSSQEFEKYYDRYLNGRYTKVDPDGKNLSEDKKLYPEYSIFKDLYRQDISEKVLVKGSRGQGSEKPKPSEDMYASFKLVGGKVNESNKTFNKETWISQKNYKIKEGETVLELFKRVLKEEGLSYESTGGYINSVTSRDGYRLAEIEKGENSGWTYKVNGKYPGVYASQWQLLPGDKVEWLFTIDYTQEKDIIENSDMTGGNNSSDKDKKEENKDKEVDKDISKDTIKFDDVKLNNFAKKHIDSMVAKGYIKGTGKNQFSPNRNMTRAEFVAILGRISGIKETSAKTSFKDINENDWFASYIKWASDEDIVNGKLDNKFDPNGNITREEMIVILNRYIVKNDIKLDEVKVNKDFNDIDMVSGYAKDAVKFGQSTNIIKGNELNRFNPKDNATRAEAVTMIDRILEMIK